MKKYIVSGLVALLTITGGFIFFTQNHKTETAVPPTSHSGIPYVALGDSYTIGEGAAEAERWPNQLVTQLKSQGIELNLVANPSRTGYTTEDVLENEIDDLKTNNPGFITLLIGVNDYFQGVGLDEFKPRFIKVLDTVQQTSPNAKLLIVTIPDYGKTPTGAQSGNPSAIEAGLKQYNQFISEESARRNLPVADIFAISQQASQAGELMNDGLHPSGSQYTKWLQAITPEAAKLLR